MFGTNYTLKHLLEVSLGAFIYLKLVVEIKSVENAEDNPIVNAVIIIIIIIILNLINIYSACSITRSISYPWKCC